MDGICRCLAPSVSVRLQGRTFRIRPLRLKHIAALEAMVLAERKSPIDVVRDKSDAFVARPDIGDSLFQRAIDVCWKDKATRVWTRSDFNQWFDSSRGIAWSLQHMVYSKGKRAFGSARKVIEFIQKCPAKELREFVRRRDQVNGTDVLSLLDWPAGGGSGSKFMLWKKCFRYMASEFGWGPRQVGELTLWQLKLYTADEQQLGGVASMSVGDAHSYQSTRRSPFEKRNKDHLARRHVRKMIAEQAKNPVAKRPSLLRRQPSSPPRRPSQVPCFP